MPVSKQIYTVAAPWTNVQLAEQFRDAFIDGGLMASWFDSFTTGAGPAPGFEEHRVMRIEFAPGKTYGTHYHWFIFRPNGHIWYSRTHTWDAVNHVATGVKSKDYLGNANTGHVFFVSNGFDNTGTHRVLSYQVTSTTTSLTRYTSELKTDFSYFLLKGGDNYVGFMFSQANTPMQPYVDLNQVTYGGLIIPGIQGNRSSPNTGATRDGIHFRFAQVCVHANSALSYGMSGLAGGNYPSSYHLLSTKHPLVTYVFNAAGTNTNTNQWPTPSSQGDNLSGNSGLDNKFQGGRANNAEGIALPAERASANIDRGTDATPVFSDLAYSLYQTDRMPIDFGIVGHFTNNTMEVQDIFQVTPEIEEWEILAFNNYQNSETPSVLMVARVI